jgi:hypothetical protein
LLICGDDAQKQNDALRSIGSMMDGTSLAALLVFV